jgi:hypothetical protein
MQNATTIVIIQRATFDIQNDGSQHGAFPFLEDSKQTKIVTQKTRGFDTPPRF